MNKLEEYLDFEPYTDAPDKDLIEVKVTGDEDLVPCAEFDGMEFDYDNFNPLQSSLIDWVDKDVNVVVAAPTSSGKTTVAEMFISNALKRGGNGIFLSPLKAVSQEKYDDWTDSSHPWSDKQVEILTGDYQLTDAKRKRLLSADVVVKTTESLDHKTRMIKSEKNIWLFKTLCLVVDEAHLLTTDRGDALETGLMRFTSQNKNSRIVLLSATMPNVDELGKWLTKLNGKPSVIVNSSWRPVQLDKHYIKYLEKGRYGDNRSRKIAKTIEILKMYPDDKFIVFCHSKNTMRMLHKEVKSTVTKNVALHNADLSKRKRNKVERKFKDPDDDLRIIIATPTLAWGINMPARRVVVVGINRGLEYVEPLQVIQMAGRSGRMGLDDKGDSYILLPCKEYSEEKYHRLKEEYSSPGKIESQLLSYKVLAFHLTSEISEKNITTKDEITSWYKRSFAYHQGMELPVFHDEEVSIDKLVQELVNRKILKVNGDEVSATKLGRVSSWLYFSPFDVADWCRNMDIVFSRGEEKCDEFIAWMLGNIDSNFEHYIPRNAKRDMNKLERFLSSNGIKNKFPLHVLAYLSSLKGYKFKHIPGLQRGIEWDIDRQIAAMKMIDRFVLRQFDNDYFDLLSLRVKNRVGWEEARLCRVKHVGPKRANALLKHGVQKVKDILKYPDTVNSLFGNKMGSKIITGAKELLGKQND